MYKGSRITRFHIARMTKIMIKNKIGSIIPSNLNGKSIGILSIINDMNGVHKKYPAAVATPYPTRLPTPQ
jgi:hypothetical protein